MGWIEERLGAGPVLLLDGATGTELERRGVRTGLPLWSAHALLENPEAVARIHGEYAEAGAEALTANTFRTQRRTLARGGLGDRARELTATAVALAREGGRRAGKDEILVLGSAPPLEDCYRPDLVPADDVALREEHHEHAANLAGAGVDGILVETMNTTREAVAAAAAACDTGLPTLVSFIGNARGQLLSGESLDASLRAVADREPTAVGVNCLPVSSVHACIPALLACGLPFFAYANQGEPLADGGWHYSEERTPEAYAEHATAWVQAGARLVGGCCGTRPDHIRALAARLRDDSRN